MGALIQRLVSFRAHRLSSINRRHHRGDWRL